MTYTKIVRFGVGVGVGGIKGKSHFLEQTACYRNDCKNLSWQVGAYTNVTVETNSS